MLDLIKLISEIKQILLVDDDGLNELSERERKIFDLVTEAIHVPVAMRDYYCYVSYKERILTEPSMTFFNSALYRKSVEYGHPKTNWHVISASSKSQASEIIEDISKNHTAYVDTKLVTCRVYETIEEATRYGYVCQVRNE